MHCYMRGALCLGGPPGGRAGPQERFSPRGPSFLGCGAPHPFPGSSDLTLALFPFSPSRETRRERGQGGGLPPAARGQPAGPPLPSRSPPPGKRWLRLHPPRPAHGGFPGPSTTGTFWLTLSLGRGNRVRLGPDLLVPSSLALSRCPLGASARAPKPRTGRLVFTASRRQAAVTQVPQASGLNGEHEVRGQRAGSAGRAPGGAVPGHRAQGAVVLHLRRAATSSVAGYEGADPSRAPPPGPRQPPSPAA